jgi:hypothetical protein
LGLEASKGLDGQGGLCEKGDYLNPNGRLGQGKEAIKMVTPYRPVVTNQVKVVTENPQRALAPLMSGVEQGDHLNIPCDCPTPEHYAEGEAHPAVCWNCKGDLWCKACGRCIGCKVARATG